MHTRIARILLKCFPRTALDRIEGEEYLGATGLHLAIAYGNDELAQVIVECGVNVKERALGTFFLPRDQVWLRKLTKRWRRRKKITNSNTYSNNRLSTC